MGMLASFRPRAIEGLMLLFTVIAIGLLVWGIIGIPWDDIYTSCLVLYVIGGGILILALIFLIILMVLRINDRINGSQNSCGICVAYAFGVTAIISFVIIVIDEIIILYNMNDEDYDHYRGHRWRGRDGKFSGSEWAAVIIATTGACIAMALSVVCLNDLIKVIKAKTSLSYKNYMDTQHNVTSTNTGNNTSMNIMPTNNNTTQTRTIQIYNTPPVNQNYLSLIGYDQTGHPIYSGNVQYVSQNPNINKNVINNNKGNNVVKNDENKK